MGNCVRIVVKILAVEWQNPENGMSCLEARTNYDVCTRKKMPTETLIEDVNIWTSPKCVEKMKTTPKSVHSLFFVVYLTTLFQQLQSKISKLRAILHGPGLRCFKN
jgi:hypothetical protein